MKYLSRIIVVVAMVFIAALIAGTITVNLSDITTIINLRDAVNYSVIILSSIVGLIILSAFIAEMIIRINKKFKHWCDEQDAPVEYTKLRVRLMLDFGIKLPGADNKLELKRGDPIKLLLKNLNWGLEYKKYKGQIETFYGLNSKVEADVYSILKNKELCVA